MFTKLMEFDKQLNSLWRILLDGTNKYKLNLNEMLLSYVVVILFIVCIYISYIFFIFIKKKNHNKFLIKKNY